MSQSYEDLSAQIDEIKTFVAEHEVKMIIAVQVSNPHRRVYDIGASWDPAIVTLDYMNILTSEIKSSKLSQ